MQRGEYFIVAPCLKERDVSYFTFALEIVAPLYLFLSRVACKKKCINIIFILYIFPFKFPPPVLLHFSITREIDLIFSANIYDSLIYPVIKI